MPRIIQWFLLIAMIVIILFMISAFVYGSCLVVK